MNARFTNGAPFNYHDFKDSMADNISAHREQGGQVISREGEESSLLKLPNEILKRIYDYLTFSDTSIFLRTCRRVDDVIDRDDLMAKKWLLRFAPNQ